jgi:hypothetical protein
MKINKDLIGKYVSVRFLDHCIVTSKEPDDLIEIEAIGRVINVTKTKIVLETWTPVTPDPIIRKDNSERTIILNKAILKIFILEITKEHQ